MLLCMLIELIEDGSKTLVDSFIVFYVKIPCSVALHFYLYPEVSKGMNLMKFANNQHDQFVRYGSEIAYVIGMV